jgi:hypothetical protein
MSDTVDPFASKCSGAGHKPTTAGANRADTLPYCLKCDRIACGQCRTPIVNPKATACPKCGRNIAMDLIVKPES